jgi:deoxyribonuclease V
VVGDGAGHPPRPRAAAVPLSPARHHPFDLTPAAARELQSRLAAGVEREDRFGPIRLVAGVDIGFEEGGRVTRAAVAVLALPELTVVETALARRATAFPYVPGLLSFREIPAALDALAALATTPDLVLCDGQGLAHPRRFGLASHLGWLLDAPSIGVAKSRLVGTHDAPGPARGEAAPLCDGDEVIGAVVRTRTGARPVFVSTGHRVGLASAIALTLACTGRYRLPETTRAAHRLASPPGGRPRRGLRRLAEKRVS